MCIATQTRYPWVIFRLGQIVCAISARSVREMVLFTDATPLPNSLVHIRGIMKLRGQALAVVDLRVLFRLSSLLQEEEKMLHLFSKLEQDHLNWVSELEHSVQEQRAFTLTTDPHQCAFGKWYDHFKTDNVALSGVLRRFDAPHQRIHAIGTEVARLVASNKASEALARIDAVRGKELSALVFLFQETRSLMRELRREIALVLQYNGTSFVVAVDSVLAVEFLHPSMDSAVEAGVCVEDSVVESIGRRAKDQSLVLILEAQRIAKAAGFEVPDGQRVEGLA